MNFSTDMKSRNMSLCASIGKIFNTVTAWLRIFFCFSGLNLLIPDFIYVSGTFLNAE
jgi:hypothetical protein